MCVLANAMELLLQDNFVNVHGLALKEGQRYHICVLANATDLRFEKSTQHLEQVSTCSNGIIVDTTPPTAGEVWVGGHQKHWRYQVCSLGHMNEYLAIDNGGYLYKYNLYAVIIVWLDASARSRYGV